MLGMNAHLAQDNALGYGAINLRLAGERRPTARRKKPTLADFGLQLTISMAAFSPRDRCMIMVADTMLSYQDVVPASEDGTEKIFFLKNGWHALFAGDPSPINGLFRRMRSDLSISETAPATNEAEELERLKSACRKAYQAERSERVVDRYLSPYGMTLDEFRKNGYQAFGPQIFAEVNREIRDFSLGIDLLVCYWISAHLWNNRAGRSHRSRLDWIRSYRQWRADGNGCSQSSPNQTPTLRDLVLCEAKFTSETATGVGRPTSVVCYFLSRKLGRFCVRST